MAFSEWKLPARWQAGVATLLRVLGLMGALPCVRKQVQILGVPLSFLRAKAEGWATPGKGGMAAVP